MPSLHIHTAHLFQTDGQTSEHRVNSATIRSNEGIAR